MALNRPQVIASAEKLVSRGKIEAAIKEYRKLLAENPNDASTLNRLGDLYARVDRIDEAVRLFSQIADRYTDDGFFVKAIAIYKKIIKLDPTRLVVYERLAELYHRQGLIPEARTQYQVLVDYYQKHSDNRAAVGILERMAALVPDDPGPHVKLAEQFRQQKQMDRALAEYRIIADLMLKHGKVDEATQVYARAIEAEPADIGFITDAVLGLKDAGHNAAAAKLLSLAVEKNPQAEKVAKLAGLGRAAPSEPPPLKVSDITHGGTRERDLLRLDPAIFSGADRPAAVREPAPPAPRPSPPPPAPVVDGEIDLVLDLSPEAPAASTEISPTDEMLRRSPESPWFEAEAAAAEVEFELEIEGIGGEGLLELKPVGTAPAPAPGVKPPAIAPPAAGTPVTAPPPAATSQPIQAPLSMYEGRTAGYEIDWRFEPEPELEIPPISLPPELAPTSSALNVEELERTSYEVVPPPVTGPRRPEDLLAEAEVFRKYGLREKAHDRLRELLQSNPRHLAANALLVTLWIDEGKHDKVLARANQVASLAEATGDDLVWPQLKGRLSRAGYRFDGDLVQAAPAAAPKKKDRLTAMLDDLAGMAPTARAPRAAAPKSEPVAEAIAPQPAPPPPAPPPPASPISAAAHGAIDEELPEIVLPIRTESMAEPPKPTARIRQPEPPAAGRAAAATPEGIAADESLSWLDQAIAQPAPRRPEEEKLFDDEEGFFDLAAELESELSKEDLLPEGELVPAPQEQSLEEIVEGFKRGVAESLSSEDYDTHYNLGIAYREMGLLDEAIGEFQLAAKESRYLVDCSSLLGGCFLEKGLPELAIKWYRRGLEAPNLPEEAFLGLLYDLGNVYLFQGDQEKARATFVEIYGVNSNYRDVVAKLAELGAHH